jgi:ADP-heptose:LPS heptosyltransferase
MTRRIAIVHYNGIGDHILTRPAIAAVVAAGLGDCSFVGLPGAAELFYRDIAFREIVPVAMEQREMGRERFDVVTVARRIQGCDLLVCLNRSESGAVVELCRQAKAARTAGFFDSFDLREPFSHRVHAAELAFALARRVGAAGCLAEFRRPIDLPAEACVFAQQLRAELGPDFRIVVLHNESAPEKQWPPQRLRQLALLILARFPETVVLTVGLADPLPDARHPRLFSADGVGLPRALAATQAADLFVGVDSCFLHAADAAGVPAVALFGPTDPQEWGPCGPDSAVISASAMAAVRLDDVWRAVDERLRQSVARSRSGNRPGSA